MRRWLIWAPLAVFAGVLWLAASELSQPASRVIRSQLVGKPLPEFALKPAIPGKPGVTSAGTGEPRLVNVFASWCVPCAAEAPQLMALKRAGVRIDAIAIRDKPADLQRFLRTYGDPYAAIGDDRTSSVQLALGSSGVPETFVVDGSGRIVAQHIGDIRADEVAGILAQVRGAR